MSKLNEKQKRFAREYVVDLNASKAAARAGYSARTAGNIGHELLKKPEIAAQITTFMNERARRTNITADATLQGLWDVANADPGELIQYRRNCCRYCWGERFEYQHTAAEQKQRRELWVADAGNPQRGAWSEEGGIGYDANRRPNVKCPECHGIGVGQVWVADTRDLKGPARQLYAGVKVTKDGLQVLMRSQDVAIGRIFDHLGLSAPTRQEVSGRDGRPIETRNLTERFAGLDPGKRALLREALKGALEDK